jgi:hypothetical protein
MAKTLAQFTIARTTSGDYLLSFESDDGETVEIEASYEQLDLIVETIEERLDSDEEDALITDDDADEEDVGEEEADRD